jgi:hypothetical protein
MSLTEKLAEVKNLSSFSAFVDALIADRLVKGSTWQNHSIENYLDAAAAWARDSKV